MDAVTYNNTTGETAVYPRETNNFGLAYCWFGLLGELSELKDVLSFVDFNDKEETSNYEKNIIKEAGDVFWYVSEICNNLEDLNFEAILEEAVKQSKMEFPDFDDNYFFKIISFSEQIKKYYRDSKPIDVQQLRVILANMLASIIAFAKDEAKANLETILEINYNKLHNRRKTGTLHGDGDHREEA